MPSKQLPITLVVEHVRSSHNIGSLFRTADAAAIEQIIFSNLCPVPPRLEISKTALGAEKTVDWSQSEDLCKTILELKNRGYTICALEQTTNSIDFFETTPPFPLVLIVGHEREGVSQELLALADHHLELPMHGTSAHSLNVSNATSIALYELGRRFWYD